LVAVTHTPASSPLSSTIISVVRMPMTSSKNDFSADTSSARRFR